MFLKAFFTPYIYILFFSFVFTAISAQKLSVKITPTDSISSKALSNLNINRIIYTTNSVVGVIDSLQHQLYLKGFLNPVFEFKNSDAYFAEYTLSAGESFQLITIYTPKYLPLSLKNKLNIIDNTATINIDKIDVFLQHFTDYFALTGYPFAVVKLSNQTIKNKTLSSTLEITLNKQRTIDKIIVEGYSAFPRGFITHQTPLKIGRPFTSQKLAETRAVLNKLSFVSEIKAPEVLFTADSTHCYMYLRKQQAHQFDGLIGFNTTENSSKLTVYGSITVLFSNLLNKGEQFYIKWNKTGTDKSSFFIENYFPYILQSPISFRGSFELQKTDSTFTSTIFNTALSYQLNSHQLSGAFLMQKSQMLTANPTEHLYNFNKNLFGLTYNFAVINQDNIFSKTFETLLKIYTGHRTSDEKRVTQQQIEVLISYLLKLNERNYLFVQNQSKKIISNHFFGNELFQLGGATTLRGFNEQELIGNAYSILNLEYRFLTSESSYFYTITDYGLVKNAIERSSHNLLGLGLGYTFKITPGYLSLTYALGKFPSTAFDVKKAKIHLSWKQNF